MRREHTTTARVRGSSVLLGSLAVGHAALLVLVASAGAAPIMTGAKRAAEASATCRAGE